MRVDVPDERRRLDPTDPAEAREAQVRPEEDIRDHGVRERDHEEVDAGAPARERAQQECDRSRDHDPDDHAPPGVPAEIEALAVPIRHRVSEREACDAEDGDLRERDHPAIGREEDQTRRGDPQEQRLREDEVDEVRRHERRRDQRRRDQGEREDGDTDAALDSVPDGRWLHAGLPKSPSGRNARTTASNTNVKMIE